MSSARNNAAGALATEVVLLAGGAGNVVDVSRCWSRLRLDVAQADLADSDGLTALPGVMLAVMRGGELHVVPVDGLDELVAAVTRIIEESRA